MVKAGFVAKRKKLRSSLSSGLHISKLEVEALLQSKGVSADDRAEDLSIQNWIDISQDF